MGQNLAINVKQIRCKLIHFNCLRQRGRYEFLIVCHIMHQSINNRLQGNCFFEFLAWE